MAVGGILHIKTGLRQGKTILRHCYHTQPFKIMDVTEDRQNPDLHLMIMNASPGVLNGDTYNIQLHLASSTSLVLHTQAYQRLFQMRSRAGQHMCVTMEEGASLHFLPHPVAPHKDSDFTSTNTIHLHKECTLLWGEVLTCGRKLCGEVFQFSSYHTKTEVYKEGKLVVKENLLVQPYLKKINLIGQLEGYTHQATVLYINERFTVDVAVERVRQFLDGIEGIEYGVSALQVNGILIRILGHKSEQLYDLVKQAGALLKKQQISVQEKNRIKAAADVK